MVKGNNKSTVVLDTRDRPDHNNALHFNEVVTPYVERYASFSRGSCVPSLNFIRANVFDDRCFLLALACLYGVYETQRADTY